MKYRLIASLDNIHARKWKTLHRLVEFGDNEKTIEYLKKRCSVKDSYTIDDEDDTDDEIFKTDTHRMTFRDMMCEEVFLYERI